MAPRLFFTPGSDASDREKVRKLVLKNYPGLLETGAIRWKHLYANQARRTGGFPPALARKVVSEFNKYTENYKLLSTNMRSWPSHISRPRKFFADVDAGAGTVELPIPVKENEQQLIFLMFPREETSLREVYTYKFDEKRHKICPWLNPEGERAASPAGRYNILLNQAITTIALESDNPYPLRFILPEDLSSLVLRSFLQESLFVDKLVAVLILNIASERDYVACQRRISKDVPVNISFLPLFVYKIKEDKTLGGTESMQKRVEPYLLCNYMSEVVDWGEHSPRKAVTYHELRDVMAKLIRPGRPGVPDFQPWVMLRTPQVLPGATMQHYLVRRRRQDDREEEIKIQEEQARGLIPVCIDWGPGGKGLRIGERTGDYCEYKGDTNDFDRLESDVMALREDLWMEFSRLDLERDAGVRDWTRELGKNIRRKIVLSFSEFDVSRFDKVVTPNIEHMVNFSEQDAVSNPEIRSCFGLYGAKFHDEGSRQSFKHIASAVRQWAKVHVDLNPLPYLVPAVHLAKFNKHSKLETGFVESESTMTAPTCWSAQGVAPALTTRILVVFARVSILMMFVGTLYW
eukprot:CAMPEP_0177608418 /NCGR_PEP_ID=MMETSP0419_2-20121207/18462_1 /TAXON_ID=582737 /ORGANISM="Tetraselmis sp., Strain GSL018" /LENGTH=574 /DNA_ID=CAMNT_0019103109 /DNA_START=318 /DNA_END=2039 /DNA_ORIENTATION=+